MIFEKKIGDAYRSRMFVRCDDNGVAKYFDYTDFEGLEKEEFSFKTKAGNTLYGCFYSYPDANRERLVIFEHGMGGGHLSYMKEIEYLAKNGFLVLSYDHTGCMRSEGEGCNGFSQSLSDLDACIEAVVKEGRYAESDISVVGHSWGAFSTMNICSLHPDVACVVAMSGFASVKRMIAQSFAGLLKPYASYIYNIEKNANPDYCDYDAAKSLEGFEGKALIIHSRDDKTVSAKIHFEYLQEALKEKENIRFLSVEGKNHNPNYTKEAVKLLGEYVSALTKSIKNKSLASEEARREFVASFDWDRMTEQDGKVWNEIISALKSEDI